MLVLGKTKAEKNSCNHCTILIFITQTNLNNWSNMRTHIFTYTTIAVHTETVEELFGAPCNRLSKTRDGSFAFNGRINFHGSRRASAAGDRFTSHVRL